MQDIPKLITTESLPEFAQQLRKAANDVWEAGYQQPFIRELGQGTLDKERFAFYLTQDELYLDDYAKVHALAVTKTDDHEIIRFLAGVQQSIVQVEGQLHREYLASFGIDPDHVKESKQSAFAQAYTSHMMTVAYTKPLLHIMVAVLPCAWVYADYGRRLKREFAQTLATNPYKPWIEMYATDKFWEDGQFLIQHIEQLVQHVTPEEKQELIDIFVTGVENEYMFWASAYDMQMKWRTMW